MPEVDVGLGRTFAGLCPRRYERRSSHPCILRRRQVRLSGRRYGDARYFNGNLCYDDFNIIWDHACGINHGLYNRKEGLAFYGENGTMVLDRAGWEVIPVVSNNVARMEAVPFKKGEGKGLYNHVGNMLSCIKSRELPNADVAIGARVAKMAHLANISCRVQREVHWDDKNNLFVGDNEATALSKAYYRAPWELPKL